MAHEPRADAQRGVKKDSRWAFLPKEEVDRLERWATTFHKGNDLPDFDSGKYVAALVLEALWNGDDVAAERRRRRAEDAGSDYGTRDLARMDEVQLQSYIEDRVWEVTGGAR
jgi:hypothetical protein